jgi:predicted anti-sigma-YlaC factor YlaD
VTFLDQVLAKTSGPVCAAAEERFVSFVVGELDAVDRELVAAHAAGCPACRRELSRVGVLITDLPRVAEIAPDAAFVGDVLRQTSGVSVPAASRWTEAWRRFALRPRFAMEVAYVGAVVLCVIGSLTDLHLRAVPELVRTMISDIKETP